MEVRIAGVQQGSPIHVVRITDGARTAVDNTRLAAAAWTKTPVQDILRGFDDAFPAARAGGNLHGEAWGNAVLNRIKTSAAAGDASIPMLRGSQALTIQRPASRYE